MQTRKDWNCGLTRVMDSLSGKWKLNIFWVIAQKQPIRFNQLNREIEGITKTMLTRSLGDLIKEDLIIKEDFKTWPLHTQYSLSPKGQELLKLMMGLNDWGRENL